MIKHLVTSGCSFSDNTGGNKWPQYLSKELGLPLYNRGQGSAGNSWISKTVIYQTQLLLDQGILPEEILVAVMWSGIDRKDLFISSTETPNFKQLISYSSSNPVNFIDESVNKLCDKSNSVDGYLLGTPHCNFNNKHIQDFKAELIVNYFSNEAMAIESYENFLRVQWFCESKKIKLINQTFMDILHYPKPFLIREKIKMTKDRYRNIFPLYNMIDFSKWIFWKNTEGFYEYTKDNNLTFEMDNIHPTMEANQYYVHNYLLPKLKEIL